MAEKTAPGRVDRRRARTRSALVYAAQRVLGEGRTDVPIQEITELADVGVGSFCNHVDSKDDLFRVAVEEAARICALDLPDLDLADTDGPARTGETHS